MKIGFLERTAHYAVAFTALALAVAFVMDRSNPSPVYHVKVMTNGVKPGENLRLQYTVDRRRTCFVESYRTIVDAQGTRFEQPKLDIASAEIGQDTYSRLFRIDDRASQGVAVMRTTLVYSCNLIHRLFPIIVKLDDQSFDID